MKIVKDKIFEFANILSQYSGGVLRLVEHEENKSEKHTPEAASFLKLNGRRLGRDLEVYAFMGKCAGEEQLLVSLLEELLLQVKDSALSYEKGSEYLKAWGHKVFDEDILSTWDELFVKEADK